MNFKGIFHDEGKNWRKRRKKDNVNINGMMKKNVFCAIMITCLY
jgi:hypothetical protein